MTSATASVPTRQIAFDYDRTVVAFHGTRRYTAEKLFAGTPFGLSENDDDWLGHGIYFCEYAPQQAWWWAERLYGKQDAAVVGELAGDLPAPGLAGTSLPDRVLIMLPVVPEYLRLLLFPARLSAEYSPNFLPASTGIGLRTLGGLLLLAVCVAAAVLLRRRAPVASAGLRLRLCANRLWCTDVVPP